ncbi:uncharacterized protein [Oryza sativa Japonica Group]|uniref:uncharacterized protein isoform X2 n=1 Tax=Oryza sativa subsp. japonica TaxID=39947 RepID=UPI00339C5291
MAQQWRSLLFLLLLLLVPFAAAAGQDAPFVVAQKKVALSRPGPGVERLAVTLNLYNQGSATAYDVSLNDDSWPQEAFQLISGTTSKIVEKLDPGATASHNFILETKVQGKFQGSPAIITYRVPTKAALQAYSTPMFPLDILAERPPQQKFELVSYLIPFAFIKSKTFPDSYVSTPYFFGAGTQLMDMQLLHLTFPG